MQISLKALENQSFVKRIKEFHENKSKLFADEPSMHFDIDIIWLVICFGKDIIDISEYYKNPLIDAIRQSEDEIAKILIMKNLYLYDLDEGWRSALEWCALCAKKELAELLLNKGVCIVDALLKAARQGDLEMVQLFVKHGANINKSNLCEHTPLMAAAKHGHKHIVEFLLKNEVNINAQDWDGNTALDYAKTDEIEQLLKEYASKQKIVPQCKVYNGCLIS